MEIDFYFNRKCAFLNKSSVKNIKMQFRGNLDLTAKDARKL